MSNRVYKTTVVDSKHYYQITEEDGQVNLVGPYNTGSKARIAMKNAQIKNHDIEPDKVPLRNRNGSFGSLIEKADVDEAIDTMKTPKDIQKIMKKLLKHPHSVRALGTILFNPYHPKYAQVLEVATRIATDVPKISKDDETQRMQPFLLKIPDPNEMANKINNAEIIGYEVPVTGSIQ